MLEKYSRIMSDASPEKTFRTGFGELRNIMELRNSLLEKGQSFYKEYVNENENHFSNWVAGVFEDKELAEKLKKTKSCEETIKLLNNRINYIEVWFDYNKEKEMLNNYLSDGFLSHKKMNAAEFQPEHHKFETLTNAEFTGIEGITAITKQVNPPKINFMPQLPFIPNSDKSEAADSLNVNPEKVLMNAVPLENTSVVKHKKEKDLEMMKLLENQFPGLSLVKETPKKKTFFEKVFSFVYQ